MLLIFLIKFNKIFKVSPQNLCFLQIRMLLFFPFCNIIYMDILSRRAIRSQHRSRFSNLYFSRRLIIISYKTTYFWQSTDRECFKITFLFLACNMFSIVCICTCIRKLKSILDDIMKDSVLFFLYNLFQ
ncbi:hypothetical protein EGW08_008621 [Elysia chlorotica]|uniref:Uncharacterized protein n=1 Tax=Elysia chlorotica TaxID=188477 RepID=A0A433TPX6_ELYCH|nr:hypothetical protein EGW08_008621 [Elysia chlorotica]